MKAAVSCLVNRLDQWRQCGPDALALRPGDQVTQNFLEAGVLGTRNDVLPAISFQQALYDSFLLSGIKVLTGDLAEVLGIGD